MGTASIIWILTNLLSWLTPLLAFSTQNPASSTWLRIIQINDVYELDNFPSLKTLVLQHSVGPDKTLVICAGDFLSPSLLSSLDKGASMIDCLNAVGITHVCFGNHEADVPEAALRERIRHSRFEWINSNMPQLNGKLNVTTPESCVIQVGSGKTTKTVALLGFLTDDPSLYRPGSAFVDAKIEPILPKAELLLQQLSPLVDLVVPMTHQNIQEDRDFCSRYGERFPIVCGGHDHEVFDEVHNASRILKTGMDATNAAIIDIQWKNDGDSNSLDLTIHAEIIPTRDYEQDLDLQQRILGHRTILKELERARLFQVSNWIDTTGQPFSTVGNRLGPSTGTTAICNMLRMGMRAECAIINAGAVRGSKLYDTDQYFMWSDLKTEIPFSCGMTACYLPGHVLEATIAHSRGECRQNPPQAFGGYLHTSRDVVYNDSKECIETIGGKLFDPDQNYLTAIPAVLFSGLDNHKPLLDWAATPAVKVELSVSEESSIPAKMVLVEVFSTLLWMQLGAFDEIDLNQDGVLHLDEVKARLLMLYGNEQVAELVVRNVFAIADMDNKGEISPLEMMIVQFAATDLIDHVCTEEELKVFKEVAASVLNKRPTHNDVKRMVELLRDTIDFKRDGKIDRTEVMTAIGKLKHKTDLLQ